MLRPNYTFSFYSHFSNSRVATVTKWMKMKLRPDRLRKCTVSHISSDQKAPGGLLQRSSAINSNRPRFRVDMRWCTTSEKGLRETEKNVHTPGNQTKRSASSDVLPPEMPPLWCGPPASSCVPCSRLWASIGSAWWMCALAAEAAAHSKHSGFIITSSLFTPNRLWAMHCRSLPTSSKWKILWSEIRCDLFCNASPQWA